MRAGNYDTAEQTAWTAYYGNYGGTRTPGGSSTSTIRGRFGAKIDAIDGWNLRGLGIWALGYDNNNGDGDLTNTIAAKFEMARVHDLLRRRPVSHPRLPQGSGAAGTAGPHVAQTFQVTGTGGVPAGATAVTGNLTVTGQTSPAICTSARYHEQPDQLDAQLPPRR